MQSIDRRKKEDINSLFCVGLSYKKSNATMRGAFAIDKEKRVKLLQEARNSNMLSLLVYIYLQQNRIIRNSER